MRWKGWAWLTLVTLAVLNELPWVRRFVGWLSGLPNWVWAIVGAGAALALALAAYRHGRRAFAWLRGPGRFPVAWAIPLIVVGLLALASLEGPTGWWVSLVLLGQIAAWILLVSFIGLPDDDDVKQHYGRVRQELWSYRRGVAIIVAGVVAVVAFTPPLHDFLLGWGGGAWAGTAFRTSLLLYLTSAALWSARAWYDEPSTHTGLYGRLVLVVLAVLAPIASLIWLHPFDGWGDHLEGLHLYRDGSPTMLWALLWIPLPLMFIHLLSLLVSLARRHRIATARSRRVAETSVDLAVKAVQVARVRKARLRGGEVTATTPAEVWLADVPPERAHRWQAAITLASLAAVVLSGALLVTAVVLVQSERRVVEDAEIAQRGAHVDIPTLPGDSSDPLAEPNWGRLAQRYSPVLRISTAELWREAGVDEVLERASLSPKNDADGHPLPCPDPADWPAVAGAMDANKPCGNLSVGDTEMPARGLPPVFAGGTVYPHVIAFQKPNPDVHRYPETRLVIEYWLFYADDRWQVKRSALGDLLQAHEGDWEVVVVGLGGDAQPLFVAYSAHCGGVWRDWKDTPVVSLADVPPLVTSETPELAASTITVGPRDQASHPLVVVAQGSHANYPTTGAREPDWGSCAFNLQTAKAMRLVSFAASVHEETPLTGKYQIPAVADPAFSDSHVATLPWAWGPSESIKLSGVLVSGPSDHGPYSPANTHEHKIWNTPRFTIFKRDHWDKDTVSAPKQGDPA